MLLMSGRTGNSTGLALLNAGMALVLAGLMIGGCAAPRDAMSEPSSVPRFDHRIAGVPFIPGDPGACGPAALASLLAFGGDPVSVDDIARAVNVPSLFGVLPMDLAHFVDARATRVVTIPTMGSPDWLYRELQADHPVVAFLDLGMGPWRRGHFVVVVGYRNDPAEVLLYSGRDPNATMSGARFMSAWKRGGWWALRASRVEERGT